MVSLIGNDGRNRRDCFRIDRLQLGHLVLEVPKDYPFDGNRGCRNHADAKEPSNDAETPAAEATQPIATTSAASSTLDLKSEDLAVLQLVRTKLQELAHKARRGQACEQELAGIDTNRAVLPRMVDSDDSAAEALKSV
jgi:hypothetical protein